jgi:hypothetical protein
MLRLPHHMERLKGDLHRLRWTVEFVAVLLQLASAEQGLSGKTPIDRYSELPDQTPLSEEVDPFRPFKSANASSGLRPINAIGEIGTISVNHTTYSIVSLSVLMIWLADNPYLS